MADQHLDNHPYTTVTDETLTDTPDTHPLGQAYMRITQEHRLVTTELKRVEAALRQSERQYQQLIERASDVVYIVNQEGYFTYANPAARKMTGYDMETLVGHHFTELLLPDWKARIGAFYARQIQEQIPETTLEFPIMTHSGAIKWVEQIVIPIFQDAQIVALQSIVRDITKRRRSEESLRDTTAQLNMLLENLQVGILMENSARQIVFANVEFCRIFGIPLQPEALVGIDYADAAEDTKILFVNPAGFMARINQLLAERRVSTAEELIMLDGRTLERDYIPLIVDGVYQGHLWQYRDITERKHMENAIVQSDHHLRSLKKRVEAILNNSSDAIIVAYADGSFQQANPAFYDLIGYQPDEIYRDHLSVLVHPDSIDLFTEQLTLVKETRTPRHIEVMIYRKDGTAFPADAALSVITSNRDGDGVQGIICSIRDITNRKRMEEDLRQALAKERELGELKTRFVSMASHEFRTPLATIQTTADALRHYLPRMTDEQRDKRFDKINAQVKHMTMMLDDVLTLGRLQNQKLDFFPVPTVVHPIFAEIVDDLHTLHQATHTIYYTCAHENLEAFVDPKLLRQIATNLLTNAIKYSPDGSSIYFDALDEQDTLILRFRDEGIGIPEEDQKHLFEAFHRANNVGNTPGTGLGLTIIQQAIELHGGTIAFQSSVGAGTTFTVCLPVKLPSKG